MSTYTTPPADSNEPGSTTEPKEVALFPIPSVVAFPGVDLPLHVFEPRYRALVNDCVTEHRMIGVCHTLKAIHDPHGRKGFKAKEPQDIEKMLNSNQTTYKPQAVFSAGHCEIIETLPDGRLLANVKITERLSLIEERQSLPYRIVRCDLLKDEEEPTTATERKTLQLKVHERFVTLVGSENPELAEELNGPRWTSLSPAAYSFQLFKCLRFDADLMQHILELRTATERLETLWQLLQGSSGD